MQPSFLTKQRTLLSSTSMTIALSTMYMLSTAPLANAQAQATQDTAIEDATSQQDTIVVTVRKKAESLLDVPLAISAFSEAQIRERSLTQLENVAMQTPGLTFEDFSNGGYGAPVIRGTSQLRVDQLEQNVSVFYDGIYIPRQYAFDLGMTNVSRIEVVKGPQSALYGANSFAGAINYVSKERSLSSFEGNVTGGIGSDGLLESSVYANIPLIKNTLAISLSGAMTNFDGDFDNEYVGAEDAPHLGTDDTLGGWDKDTYGAGLTFATGAFSAKLDYNKFNALNEDGPHYRLNRENRAVDFNCSSGFSFGQPVQLAYCGELPSDIGSLTNLQEINGLIVDPRSYSQTETEMIRGEMTYDLTDNIGLTYQYGNVKSDILAVSIATRDPAVPFVGFGLTGSVFTFGPNGGFDYKTHELRADFEFENGVNALVGAFYLDGQDVDNFQSSFEPFGSLEPITEAGLVLNSAINPTDTITKSIFGRVEIPFLNERMNVGLEGRYSETEKETIQAALVATPEQAYTYDTSTFTPRLTVDFDLTDDILLYASAAAGEKSGGINTSSVVLTDAERTYDEDENITYEIGSKAKLFNGRATLNGALYRIEWDNLQVTKLPDNGTGFTSGIVTNLGAATSQGIEIDGTFEVTDNITLNGGFTVIDATYDDGTFSQGKGALCPATSEVCSSNADGEAIIGGNNIARVPDFQWNVGAQYDGQIGDNTDYYIRADVAGQSEQYVSEINLATIEERVLTNFRSGLLIGPITAELWVTNVFDEEYVSNSFFIAAAFDTSYIPTFGAKRRIGATVSYDF